jgi:hypothetical protein
MPRTNEDAHRVTLVMSLEYQALADEIAKKLGDASRSQAVRFALEKAAESLGIKRNKKTSRGA